MMSKPQADWAVAVAPDVIEESPYSTGHDAGEIPGRSDLSDRATENDSRGASRGYGEKVV